MLAILLNNKRSNQIYKYFCQVLYCKNAGLWEGIQRKIVNAYSNDAAPRVGEISLYKLSLSLFQDDRYKWIFPLIMSFMVQ